MKISVLAAAAAAAICVLGAAPAQAAGATNRVWVSGHGVDQAGCGPPIAPCRSLQYAHDNVVAAGGEIDILDPAGYGAVTITKAVSIVNDGAGTAGLQATGGGVAITINAGPNDAITLRGLELDGVQEAGWFGVILIGGRNLTMTNCVVRHFLQGGIYLSPISGPFSFVISNTMLSDNGDGGLTYSANGGSASASGVIDHVTATDNFYGLWLVGSGDSGTLNVNVSNSVISANTERGVDIEAAAANTTIAIDTTHISANGADGLVVKQLATVHLSSSYLDENALAGINNLTSGGGSIISSQDNHIYGNAGGVLTGASLLTEGQH